MFSVLEQLNIEFQPQLTKTTFKWCEDYKYDFYIPFKNKIIEVHGIQHYEEHGRKGGRNLQEETENDRVKKELAITNGIKEENYITIDCRESNLEFIKDKIIHSRLNKIFNLHDINWLKAEEYACKSLVKKVCSYKKNDINLSTTDICKITKLSLNTVIRYLKRGNNLGWCDYNIKKEAFKRNSKLGKLSGKAVKIFKDGISLGVFESGLELSRQSEELFGVKLISSAVSNVCREKIKQYKGYTFKYVENNLNEAI